MLFRAVWLRGNALTSLSLGFPTSKIGMALLFIAPVSQLCCGDSVEYVKWLAHSKDVASEGWLCYSDFFTPISTETGFRLKTGLGQQGGRFPRTCSGSAEDGEVRGEESARNPRVPITYCVKSRG